MKYNEFCVQNHEDDFVHLHLHSEYSLLDGSGRITEIIQRVKELGMKQVALTDHGVMHGVVDFYKAAKKEGIHPILGCETYVAPRSHLDKEGRADAANYHLVLLAETQEGYQNLMKLVSIAYLEGFYYRPRVDRDLLKKYHKGIIALSACLGGHISQLILQGDLELAETTALEYQAIFGEGNYFLELQNHGYEAQTKVNQALIAISEKTGIPLVATNDAHYVRPEDAEAHDILLCIQTGKKVSDPNRMRYLGGQLYIKSPAEMRKNFPDEKAFHQALSNTVKIAERCQVELEFGQLKLPKFPVPAGYRSIDYLKKLCEEGLESRYGKRKEEYRKRLEYELSVIEAMGYADYFLIVSDFIRFAKSKEIMVGPGRGSAAGSLVAYVLQITNIDPIAYGLIFERFLNPERISMPDIDIDFCYERRQEVIDYVIAKYGELQVSQIITFGTMAAKAVIRDVGRVLDLPYPEVDAIAKMIPNELKMTIDKALEMNEELRLKYQNEPMMKRLIDTARKLEGLPRHASTHAAGVVICDRPVYEYVPLYSADGMTSTQFPMGTLEELGLLKMDFLGLRTLTVIQDTVRAVVEKGISFDLESIDYSDKKVFDLISTGKTDGIFQLESAGMKSFMKSLKPQNMEDIIAGISLFRPGPMSSIPAYVGARHDTTKINYVTPELEPILKSTYGCIVYQEQVMQIVRDLAGYTYGRSDLVRRAMSKKKDDVMERERRNFLYGSGKDGVVGCLAKGISEDAANQIFDDMSDFAKYAFNKSHAAAYAVIAYQTAYLKCYYPVEFMAALISSVISNPTKTTEYMLCLKDMGIQLLPPNINQSRAGFHALGDTIVFGLSAIKNVGKSMVEAVEKERAERGEFRSLSDYCRRMDGRDLNKRALENLIKAGAFDCLGGNRKQYLLEYADILKSVQIEKKDKIDGQVDLFEMDRVKHTPVFQDALPEIEDFQTKERLTMEKEVMGIYVSGHPLMEQKNIWEANITVSGKDFHAEDEEMNLQDGKTEVIGGVIVGIRKTITKKGEEMAFVTLEDFFTTMEVILFPKDYLKYYDILMPDATIFVKGRISMQGDREPKVIAEMIWSFDERTQEAAAQNLWLAFADEDNLREKMTLLRPILKTSPGKSRIFLYLRNSKQTRKMMMQVEITDVFLMELYSVLGIDSVAVK